MGFFNNLFGKKQEPQKEDNIFRILGLDINDLPNNKFIKGETDTNISGDKITNYRKLYKEKIIGIFDIVEVKVFENKTSKNIILSTNGFVSSTKIWDLVDKLFLIYGNDSSGNGRFRTEEFEDIDGNYWSGRMWTDIKYEFPIYISYSDEGYSLVVFCK